MTRVDQAQTAGAGDDPLPGVVPGPLVRTSAPGSVLIEVPGSRSSGALAPVVESGLRRVGPGEERLADADRRARRFRRAQYGEPVTDTNTLAGYE